MAVKVYFQYCVYSGCLLFAVAALKSQEMYSSPRDIFRYQDPRQILGSSSPLVLYRISSNRTPPPYRCMRSILITKEGSEYIREVRYITPKIIERQVVFENNNITFIMVPNIRTQSQPFIQLKPQGDLPSAARTWLKYPDTLKQRVLFADSKCILLGNYIQSGGRTFCFLWLPETAVEEPPNHCDFMVLSLCGEPLYNAFHTEFKFCSDIKNGRHWKIINKGEGKATDQTAGDNGMANSVRPR